MSTADKAFTKALDLVTDAGQTSSDTRALALATRALVHAQLAGVAVMIEQGKVLDATQATVQGMAGIRLGGDDPDVVDYAVLLGMPLEDGDVVSLRTLAVDKDGDAWRMGALGWTPEYDASDRPRDTHELLYAFGPCRVVWVP